MMRERGSHDHSEEGYSEDVPHRQVRWSRRCWTDGTEVPETAEKRAWGMGKFTKRKKLIQSPWGNTVQKKLAKKSEGKKRNIKNSTNKLTRWTAAKWRHWSPISFPAPATLGSDRLQYPGKSVLDTEAETALCKTSLSPFRNKYPFMSWRKSLTTHFCNYNSGGALY